MGWMADEIGLHDGAANHVPLTPLSHLNRAADVFADRTALVDGASALDLCRRCTTASPASPRRWRRCGVGPGDVVATLLPNIAAQVEAHFGVPACGAVLNTINTRLDAGNRRLYPRPRPGRRCCSATARICDLAEAAFALMAGPLPAADRGRRCPRPAMPPPGAHPEYEAVLAAADPGFRLDHARGRMGKHRAQLHLGHHRPAQGRGLLTTAAPISRRCRT